MQIKDSDFTRPKEEYSSYFGRPYDVLVVSDDCEYGSLSHNFAAVKPKTFKLPMITYFAVLDNVIA